MDGLKQKLSIIICCQRDPILQCSQIFRGQYLIKKLGGGGINSRELTLGIHFYHDIPLLTAPLSPQ